MKSGLRQSLLIASIAVLPALFLILTLWVYQYLVERMRIGLHEQRANLIRSLTVPPDEDHSRPFLFGRLASDGAAMDVFSGEIPEEIGPEDLLKLYKSHGSATSLGVETSLGRGAPNIVWIIPEEEGFRVAIQSRRSFYARLESLRVLIWTAGLLCMGVVFILFVSLARKMSDLFMEMEEKNRELERANRHLEELGTLKSSFLALVSHELRTPLARLNGHFTLIKQQYLKLPAEVMTRFDEMRVDLEELSRMTKNALDLTRLQSEDLAARVEPGQIAPVVEMLLDRIRPSVEHAGLKLSVLLPELPPVNHDPYLFERILDNLLLNAVKYSRPQGEIRLEFIEDDDKLRVHVESDGETIPDNLRDKIFEKFFRATEDSLVSGSGLGLYIVRQFILMMGGRAWVEPTSTGNRFVITLILS